MAKFLIDVNLPSKFSLWNSEEFVFVKDLNTSHSDSEIWNMAKENNQVIVTKDRDFYDRILQSNPPPKIIYVRFGNLKMQDFFKHMSIAWPQSIDLINSRTLVIDL